MSKRHRESPRLHNMSSSNNNDKIFSDEQSSLNVPPHRTIENVVSERVMEEAVDMLMEFRRIKEQIRVLDEKVAQMQNAADEQRLQATSKRGMYITFLIGVLQIIIMLYQIFGK